MHGVGRKLKQVGQTMDPIMTQRDLAEFLNNSENAQELNLLVEDIRYALIDYRVCSLSILGLVIS